MSDMSEFLRRLRIGDDQLSEVRHLSEKRGIFYGYFDDLEKLEDLTALYQRDGNFYVTLNPVDPDCRYRVHNGLVRAGRNSTKNFEITCRTNLLIDFDPVRMSGIPSTDAEHQAALDRAEQVKADLAALGWPDPMLTDSGNGAGLIYRIDLPTDVAKLVQQVLKALANRYNDESVEIDLSVNDPARVTRLIGTFNCKGEDTKVRPHRLARLIEAPEQLETVMQGQLESLVGSNPKPRSNAVEFSGFSVSDWLDGLGIEYAATQKPLGEIPGTWYALRFCPSKGQDDGNSAIFQSDDGLMIRYKCHHDKCKKVGWKEIREILDPTFPKQAPCDPVEDVKNPHYLAEVVLQQFAHPEHCTIMLVKGEPYTWENGVWTLRTEQEIRRIITRCVKAEFDRVALEQETVPYHVTTSIISNVYAALASMIEVHTEPGSWITGQGPSVDELMICENGIVNLRAFAEGHSDYLIPHTPRLFALSKRAFAFDANASEPSRWMQFLDELWPGGAENHALLQEFFGYCLTDDCKHQKFRNTLAE